MAQNCALFLLFNPRVINYSGWCPIQHKNIVTNRKYRIGPLNNSHEITVLSLHDILQTFLLGSARLHHRTSNATHNSPANRPDQAIS